MVSFFYLLLHFMAKISAALFIIKFVGYFLEPAEFGQLTQYMAFLAILFSLPMLGGINYLTKSLSMVEKNSSEWVGVLQRALGFGLFSTAIIVVGIIISSSYIEEYVFVVHGASPLIYIYLVVAYALNCFAAIAFSAASVARELRFTVLPSVAGSLLYMLTVYAGYLYGGYGSLYWTLPLVYIYPPVLIFFLMLFGNKLCLSLKPAFEGVFFASCLKFGSLVIVGVISVPMVGIFIRQEFSNIYGWDELGNWQAAVKISDTFQQFAGILLSYLVLPFFVRLRRGGGKKYFAYAALGYGLFSVITVLSFNHVGGFILYALYGEAYQGAMSYMQLYWAGDFCRVAALTIVFYYLSIEKLKIPFLYEAFQGFAYLFLVSMFIEKSALIVSFGYFFTYALGALLLFSYLWFTTLRKNK